MDPIEDRRGVWDGVPLPDDSSPWWLIAYAARIPKKYDKRRENFNQSLRCARLSSDLCHVSCPANILIQLPLFVLDEYGGFSIDCVTFVIKFMVFVGAV